MKTLRKKAPPAMPAWHPDFRDVDSLPDVKVVRTSFFINGVGVLLLVAAAIFMGVQEFRQSNLRAEIRSLEEKISEHQTRNNQALQMHRTFQAEQRYIEEVADYLEGSLELSKLLVALGESLHPDMLLSSMRYQAGAGSDATAGRQVIVNGSIRATPDAAAGVITDYLNVFHENPFLERRISDAVPTSLVPTQAGDQMAFGIQLILKSGKIEDKKEENK